MAKTKQTSGGTNMVSLEVAAALLKVTPRRVQQLVKEGWITKSGRGGYSLIAVVHGYIDFLQDETRRSSKSASSSRVTDARTREIELRIEERSGKLVDEARAAAADLSDLVIGGLRADLMAVPARVTAHIETRRKIEAAIDDALRKAADRAQAQADAATADVGHSEAGSEIDA